MQTSWTIQPGQRLATGPERNFAREEVTNHVKPKGRRMIGHNASEGIEPRNFRRRIGPKVTSPGSQHCGTRYGECVATCRGLSPWQVIQRFASELGRAMSLLKGKPPTSRKKARKRYGGMAVGPTHSRGVVGVMSGEGTEPTRRGWQQNAKGCGDVCRAPNRIPHVFKCPYNDTEPTASSGSSAEEPDVGNLQVRFCEGR